MSGFAQANLTDILSGRREEDIGKKCFGAFRVPFATKYLGGLVLVAKLPRCLLENCAPSQSAILVYILCIV